VPSGPLHRLKVFHHCWPDRQHRQRPRHIRETLHAHQIAGLAKKTDQLGLNGNLTANTLKQVSINYTVGASGRGREPKSNLLISNFQLGG
jgi:hypothetical protein